MGEEVDGIGKQEIVEPKQNEEQIQRKSKRRNEKKGIWKHPGSI